MDDARMQIIQMDGHPVESASMPMADYERLKIERARLVLLVYSEADSYPTQIIKHDEMVKLVRDALGLSID